MADEVRGLPLEEFSKNVPPGWKPHQFNYPLRLYLEKLQLWLRTTELTAESVGPTVVGRLKGAAYRVAMKIRAHRQDGSMLVGVEAISAPREAAGVDAWGKCSPGLSFRNAVDH